jgi:putative transposase
VERWFAELTTKQIRRGAHRSVNELERAIAEFLDAHNAHPKPFAWTKSTDQILASIARFAQRTADTQTAQLMPRTTVTGH